MGWDYFADLICLNFNEPVKLKQRTIAKLRKFSLFSFFQSSPQCDFGFPSRSSYVASCWEGSYPSSTNLVPQTNFKVLKNSQNLDLWGLKQLLRIHLLTKLLLLHLLCFGADFASLLHSIGLGSRPKRAAFDLFLLKMEQQYYPCHNSHGVFSFKNAIFDIK